MNRFDEAKQQIKNSGDMSMTNIIEILTTSTFSAEERVTAPITEVTGI